MANFSVDDFFKFIKYLRGEEYSDDELDPKLKSLLKSEQATTSTYFERVQDQIAHSSPDYARLRQEFIDWYASHKTIVTSGKQANDVFSLPDAHVDELIRSFGFGYPTDLLQYFTNKRSFFLDLVNLYKIKGTPESIIKVLTYYGFQEVDIGEYWLRRGDEGNLVFRGEYVTGTGSIILGKWTDDIKYPLMVSGDPHWFLNEAQAEEMVRRSQFSLPTKSPYFALRPKYDLSSIDQVFSIITWQVQKDYAYWKAGGTLTRDIKVRGLNYVVSFLELYTAMVYSFNETFQREVGSQNDANIICYDGTATTYTEMINDYNRIVVNPVTRAERDSRLIEYQDTFTRPRETHPFQIVGDAGTTLEQLYPELKNVIDSYISTGRGEEPLGYLMREFDYWVQANISAGAPFLSLIVLGIDSHLVQDIKQLINFFKPYRARMSAVEVMYVTKNPLLDSIRVDDEVIEKPTLYFDDYINWGKPCCTYPDMHCPEVPVESYYNRDTYDCGSYHDIGASFDKRDCFIYIQDEIDDARLICRKGWDTNIQQTGYTLDSSSEVEYAWVDGGWSFFDESGIFDCITGMETVQITVESVP